MHIVQFLLEFILGENIEGVKAALPETVVRFIVNR